jgi:hypothetical protein
MTTLTPPEREARKMAYAAVRTALRSGGLVRPSACEDCGRTVVGVHAHHHKGYEAEHRLDVVWLCWDCHAWRHATGHRRYEPLPADVKAAFAVITDWAARPVDAA